MVSERVGAGFYRHSLMAAPSTAKSVNYCTPSMKPPDGNMTETDSGVDGTSVFFLPSGTFGLSLTRSYFNCVQRTILYLGKIHLMEAENATFDS